MPNIFGPYDQAALDAQYNNRALVPNFAAHLEQWARESEAVRRRLSCSLGIAYGSAPLERLDLFPAQRNGAPLHVFIHGGYWRALDKSSFSYLAPVFVDAGISYAALNYPLTPTARLDSIVQSVRSAILWLATHADDLGIDPYRIAISGHSAGGHLVAMVVATDWLSLAGSGGGPVPNLAAALSLSGLYDLEPIRLSFLNADLCLDQAEAARNSPIGLFPKIIPPLMVAVGAFESQEFRRQQSDFEASWRGHGHAVDSRELEAHNHFTIVQEIGRVDSPVHRFVIENIKGS